MTRFIFTPDGIAINVAHIVTIFVQKVDRTNQYVVRCRTSLDGREYVNAHALLNLSGPLPDLESAQMFLDASVKGLLNPPAETPQ